MILLARASFATRHTVVAKPSFFRAFGFSFTTSAQFEAASIRDRVAVQTLATLGAAASFALFAKFDALHLDTLGSGRVRCFPSRTRRATTTSTWSSGNEPNGTLLTLVLIDGEKESRLAGLIFVVGNAHGTGCIGFFTSRTLATLLLAFPSCNRASTTFSAA